jgi:hypothetical protein
MPTSFSNTSSPSIQSSLPSLAGGRTGWEREKRKNGRRGGNRMLVLKTGWSCFLHCVYVTYILWPSIFSISPFFIAWDISIQYIFPSVWNCASCPSSFKSDFLVPLRMVGGFGSNDHIICSRRIGPCGSLDGGEILIRSEDEGWLSSV